MAIMFEKLRPPKEQIIDIGIFGHHLFEVILSISAFFVFLLGLIYAQMGIFIVSNIASHRMKRRPGYNDDVFPAASFGHRLAELDEIDRGATVSDQKLPNATDE